jgi:nucleotide-binding universal stress UspA family protein
MQVVQYAVALPGADSPRFTVVHAVKSIEAVAAVQSPAGWMVPDYWTQLLDDARRGLEAVTADVPHPVRTRARVAAGSHAKAVVEVAEVVDADLVVVGRSGRFRPLGSTALRVLRDNKRALLAVPTTDASAAVEGAERYRSAA